MLEPRTEFPIPKEKLESLGIWFIYGMLDKLGNLGMLDKFGR